jgi:hypothetical protein
VDIDAVAAGRHCHGFVLVVGKLLDDDRLGVEFTATLMIARIKWQ